MASAFKSIVILLAIIAFWGAYKVAKLLTPPPLPQLDENYYWGPGKPKPDDTSIKPFKINVPDEVLKDLNHRLAHTRPLAPPLEGINFEYGFNSETLQKILTFWKTKYNWRERETFLNQFPQFKTQIQGLDIHYIHVNKDSAARTIPLLLLHGWPGSIREFYSLIPLLTKKQPNADFVFEVIVPSLPGYGFSQGATRPGLGAVEMAVIFKNLMKRLGHERFYVQGGDWGSFIASSLSTLYPKTIIGHHSNMCSASGMLSNMKILAGSIFPSLIVDKKYEHKMYPLSKAYSFLLEESGYMHIQATKPDTVGVALSDSPAGLAAYILEKFSTWTEPSWKQEKDGGLTNRFTYADLLDNIMIYWVSGSITTSMRLYSEVLNKRHFSLQLDSIPSEVPTACVRFKNELMYIPDSVLVDKFPNLVQSNDYDDGGHFAAFQVPELLAQDIWSAFIKINNAAKQSQTKNQQ